MKAILATPSGAQLQDVAPPAPSADQVLVRVRAASLNRADLRTLANGLNDILGMEWSGDVIEVGGNVKDFAPGDRVMCSGSRAFAEYAVTDRGRVAHIPESLSYRAGASMMLALQTMHNAVVTHGRVQAGDAVLIHGASSGVGLMAAQIARLKGARLVIGTSRNEHKRQVLEAAGFDLAVDASQPDWTAKVLEATGDKGADVIVDQVAGEHFNDLIRVSALLARIVNVGRLGGPSGPFDFETHALKRITYTGVTFRTRTADEVRELTSLMMQDLGKALADGSLAMPLDSDFPLEQAQAAYDRMAANQHFGKITLRLQGD